MLGPVTERAGSWYGPCWLRSASLKAQDTVSALAPGALRGSREMVPPRDIGAPARRARSSRRAWFC